MTRPICHGDIEKFLFVANPKISPKGDYIAYTVSATNKEDNCYNTNLWLYSFADDKSRQLTFSNKEGGFAWARCGCGLYFFSGRDKTKIEKPIVESPRESKLYWLSLRHGGEAQLVATLPYSCGGLWPIGEGKVLTIASMPKPKDNPEEANYYRTNELPFAANGAGFLQPERGVVLLVDTKTGETKELTPQTLDVGTVRLNADASKALLVVDEYDTVRGLYNHVYRLDLASHKLEKLTDGLVMGWNDAGWRGDEMILLGSDLTRMGCNSNPYFYKLEEGAKLKNLTPSLDTSCHSSVGCDLRYGQKGGESFVDLDGSLVFNTTHGFKSNLFALQGDGLVRQVTELTAVDAFSVAGDTIALTGHEGLRIAELYSLKGGVLTRLTDHNGPLYEELDLATPEYHSFDNGQGLKLDGWILRPKDYVKGQKYPSILHIHGGPKTVFGETLFHEMQCWAADGYIVYYCNPRGGDGRPDGFDDIRGHYGDWDYHDLMAFTDYVMSVEPGIDPARMGVTGGSYGGYMTNWIVGQTDRFAAACAQRPISNWVSKFGSSDIGYFFVPDQHGGGNLWDNMEGWWNDSPLKYAHRCTTPLLLIQSIDDFRCELTQSTQMFTALKTRGVECEMCLFIGENHELSRSGKPRERLARLREINSWFNRHLKK